MILTWGELYWMTVNESIRNSVKHIQDTLFSFPLNKLCFLLDKRNYMFVLIHFCIDGLMSICTYIQLGGPSWKVPLGRRDSTTANLTAANNDIPPPTSNLSALISSFANQGLSVKDLVSLSGYVYNSLYFYPNIWVLPILHACIENPVTTSSHDDT